MATKEQRRFILTPVEEYGQVKIYAELQRLADEGWTSLDQYGSGEEQAMRHVRVTAYVGHGYSVYADEAPGEVWGERVRFVPGGSIDSADEAMGIARAFAKVERGLTRIREAEGWHKGYAGLVVHVARVLKVDTFAVRNRRGAREMTGEVYRTARGGDLESWVRYLSHDLGEGRRSEWFGR